MTIQSLPIRWAVFTLIVFANLHFCTSLTASSETENVTKTTFVENNGIWFDVVSHGCYDFEGDFVPYLEFVFDFGSSYVEQFCWSVNEGPLQCVDFPDEAINVCCGGGVFISDIPGFESIPGANYLFVITYEDASANQFEYDESFVNESCSEEEFFCDCIGQKHELAALDQLGNAYLNDGSGLDQTSYNGNNVYFNCPKWGCDCIDCDGASMDDWSEGCENCLDPYGVCSGYLPPNNGCEEPGGGCTDTNACNYNPNAEFDDGSCFYCSDIDDITPPVFSNLPDDLVIGCYDAIPDATEVLAIDNCAESDVYFSEEYFGDMPPEGSVNHCQLTGPDITDCGNDYDPDWSMYLLDFSDGQAFSDAGYESGFGEFYSINEGSYTEYPDGTATVNAILTSDDNANAGWVLEVNLIDGLDWNAWTSSGVHGYRDDCVIAGDEYLNWKYFIVSNTSSLEGWGDFAGSFLTVSHAPVNNYYGYQVGRAANNANAECGSSSWIFFDGNFVDASTGFETTVGASSSDGGGSSGGLAFNHDCCPSYWLERTWVAVDNCGNEANHTQVISFENLDGSCSNTECDECCDCEIEVLDNYTFECDEFGGGLIYSAFGECDGLVVEESVMVLEGDCPANVTYVIEYVISSDCGDEVSGTQVIEVVDATEPVFDPFEPTIDVPCGFDPCESLLLTATDNCSDLDYHWECENVSGNCAGMVIMDVTAVDYCGNESYAQQVIQIVDEVSPWFTNFPEDVVVDSVDDFPQCSTIDLSFDDNCLDVAVVFDGPEIVDNGCELYQTCSWTITDECGNSTTQSWIATVPIVAVDGCTDSSACNYDVLATCDDGSCAFMEYFEIEGEEMPVVDIEYSYFYENTEGSVYSWDISPNGTINSGQGSNEIQVTWSAVTAGWVSVFETDTANCISPVDTLAIDVLVSHTDVPLQSFQIFPNPASGFLTVQVGTMNNGPLNFSVLNNLGQVVLKTTCSGKKNFDISHLSDGLYLVLFNVEGEVYRQKLVVRHE